MANQVQPLNSTKNEEESGFQHENATVRLGEILFNMSAITQDQLHIGLREQSAKHQMLGETLLRLGFIEESSLARALAERANVQHIELSAYNHDYSLLSLVSPSLMRKYMALPLKLEEDCLEMAMADPFDILAIDDIMHHFPKAQKVIRRVANKSIILEIIRGIDRSDKLMDDIIVHLESGTRQEEQNTHPVVRLVEHILEEGVIRGASDIHFEPEDNFVRIRFRIDGMLRQVRALHREHWSALSHRIKILSKMNIANTRSIQDGRFQLTISGNVIDFRVAIMPTVWGETIAIRVLDHKKSLIPLHDLGYSSTCLKKLESIFSKPQGLVFITGPTGSGKTTTLYSILKRLSSLEVHTATLEDPIEFQLNLIRQTNIQEATGLNFAAGVRGILRMDPDIILIGEVRDPETAQMALRAAMTGHQVFSTLHCNEALAAIPRLIDLGLNPRILAGNISGLIGQRLVRKLCPYCKKSRPITTNEDKLLQMHGKRNVHELCDSAGCTKCDFTGRKGRIVLAEIIPISTDIDDMIANDGSRKLLLEQAIKEGFVPLQRLGIERVIAGEISLQDLAKSVDLSRNAGLIINEAEVLA